MRNRLGNTYTTQIGNEISSFTIMYTNQFGAFENDKRQGLKNTKYQEEKNKPKKKKGGKNPLKSALKAY